MQIKVQIGALRDAIAQASHTLDTKVGSTGTWLYLIAQQTVQVPEKPATSKLYLYSSNLGLLRTLSKIEAEVEKQGEAAVSPKLLSSALLGLPAEDQVELSLSPSGSRLQVRYGQVKSDIACLADAPKSSTYMKTIPFSAKPITSIAASSLVDIINRLLFCTASGDNMINEGPWLNSIYLESSEGTIWSMATNRALAGQAIVVDSLIQPGFKAGIHRDAMQALKSLLAKRKQEEVTITVSGEGDGSEVLFRFSDVILGVRLIGKPYPVVYKKVFKVPEKYQTVTVGRKQLSDLLNRLVGYAETDAALITFNGDKIAFVTKGFNSAIQETLVPNAANTSGTASKIGLSVPGMQTVLVPMVSDTVTIQFAGDNDSVYFIEGPKESEFRYVLSPVTPPWVKGGK